MSGRPERGPMSSVRLACCLVLLAGCDDPKTLLLVDLRTDYTPGAEIARVAWVVERDPGGSVVQTGERPIRVGEDLLAGERLTEVEALAPGPVHLRVTLLAATGHEVAARRVGLELRGRQSATVVITRSCRDRSCPEPGGDPMSSACVGGRCVDPRCTPETPAFCDEAGCATADDCPRAVPCAIARCVDRECLYAADDEACGAGERCELERGCAATAADGGIDAGPACVEDADCGEPTFGDFGGCDWASFCDESAERTRTVSRPRCVEGACTLEEGTDSEACERETGGIMCDDTEIGPYGACGGFDSACDETGTRSRSETEYSCSGGFCRAGTPRRTSSPCTRTTEGDRCSWGPMACPGTCGDSVCVPECGRTGCPC